MKEKARWRVQPKPNINVFFHDLYLFWEAEENIDWKSPRNVGEASSCDHSSWMVVQANAGTEAEQEPMEALNPKDSVAPVFAQWKQEQIDR